MFYEAGSKIPSLNKSAQLGRNLLFSPSWRETFSSVPVGEKPFVQSQLERNLFFSPSWGETFCSVRFGEKPFVQSQLGTSYGLTV